MSKIRIYELARELGIDNKQVIACAKRLGLADKSSHSNSLEDNEADLIRRAIIRHAMGSSNVGSSNVGSSGAGSSKVGSSVNSSFSSSSGGAAGSAFQGGSSRNVVSRSLGGNDPQTRPAATVVQRSQQVADRHQLNAQSNVVHRRRRVEDEEQNSTPYVNKSSAIETPNTLKEAQLPIKDQQSLVDGQTQEPLKQSAGSTLSNREASRLLDVIADVTSHQKIGDKDAGVVMHSSAVGEDEIKTSSRDSMQEVLQHQSALSQDGDEINKNVKKEDLSVTNGYNKGYPQKPQDNDALNATVLESAQVSGDKLGNISKEDSSEANLKNLITPVEGDLIENIKTTIVTGPKVLGMISSIARKGEGRAGGGKSGPSAKNEYVIESRGASFHRRGGAVETASSTVVSGSRTEGDRGGRDKQTHYRSDKPTTDRPVTERYRSDRPLKTPQEFVSRQEDVAPQRSRADRSGSDYSDPSRPREPSRLIRAELPKTTQGVTSDGSGPKILGRIVLPTRKAAAGRVEVRRGDEIIEEEDDTTTKKKGRARKREISRKDLLDYEGQDSRKGRGHKSARGGRQGDVDDSQKHEFTGPKASKRVVRVDEFITVGDLAHQMSLKAGDVIKKLIGLGVMATINQTIDKDTALIIAEEFGYQIESISFDEGGLIGLGVPEIEGEYVTRPPLVTVMGHVDHGKTSLLDKIRKTTIADKEHGGITQHIGAYQVILEGDRRISFLDTPGHAAFTAMRARGAEVTDIVVLVVAADDGVMPQTVEAINHAKAAGVPIIVAVNKMDKPSANPDRIKQQLAEHGLQPEDWGGETMFVPVSALSGDGVEDLLESILLLAEIKELKAVVDSRARGTIIEASQERGFGTVATVLVQQGTLRLGDIFVAGAGFGRVRSIRDERGEKIEEVFPSMPVRVTGFDGAPLAGDDFIIVESDTVARQIAENRTLRQARADRAGDSGPISLEEFQRRSQSRAAEELNVILKADVQGSVEAVKQAIHDLSTGKVIVKVLHSAVGGITESDIQLAIASNALVFGFGVRAEPRALGDAEAAGITVAFFRVIYELVDAVKKAMLGLLAPDTEEVPLGRAEVRDTFVVPKIGTIAGCYISDGIVKRGAFIRVVRDSRVVYQGKMGSLRRFKEDVKQVQSGYECGLSVENFNDVKLGDVFEVYELKEIAPTL
jgi:translation initiation factor IF-2